MCTFPAIENNGTSILTTDYAELGIDILQSLHGHAVKSCLNESDAVHQACQAWL